MIGKTLPEGVVRGGNVTSRGWRFLPCQGGGEEKTTRKELLRLRREGSSDFRCSKRKGGDLWRRGGKTNLETWGREGSYEGGNGFPSRARGERSRMPEEIIRKRKGSLVFP